MVEQRSSTPYVWVRSPLSLFIINNSTLLTKSFNRQLLLPPTPIKLTKPNINNQKIIWLKKKVNVNQYPQLYIPNLALKARPKKLLTQYFNLSLIQNFLPQNILYVSELFLPNF